jgi:O-antigen ligase
MADTNRLTSSSAAFWCFALAVALLPFGLGGNRPLPFGLAQAMLSAAACILVLRKEMLSEIYLFSRLRVALGLLCAVGVWAFLQTTSLFPAAWDHPLWQEAATILPVKVHGTIAIAPDQSLKGLGRYITYIACGLLAYVLGQRSDNAQRLLRVIWYSGIAMCIYGILVYLAGNHTILWFEKWAYFGDLTGAYVNRNHFAVYAGMVFVIGVARLLQSWREGIKKIAKPHPAELMRNWLLKRLFPQVALLLLVLLCILLSHSRAGLVLTLAGTGAYLFFHQLYQKAWKRSIVIGLLAVMGLAGIMLLAGHFSGRFAVLFSDNSSLDRFKVYGLTWDAIKANPLLGYGLDGFEDVFRFYQRGMIMEFNRAHSDVLESLLDLGIPAGLMLWAAVATLASGLLHGVLTRRRNGMYPCLGLAVSVIVIGHALVDFSLQIPGVVFCWVALVGTGLAQSWGQSEKQAYLDKNKD